MGLTGTTSFRYNTSGVVRTNDKSGRTDTNWHIFTGYWMTYNSVSPYELWPGESCYGVTSRITIRTDASGATSFTWTCPGSGSSGSVKWNVTTSTTKPSSGYSATLSSGTWKGTASIRLAPSTTYYLWIWQAGTCRVGTSDTSTLSVSASGVYGAKGTVSAKVDGTEVSSATLGSTIALSFAGSPTTNATYTVKYTYTPTGGSATNVWLRQTAGSASTMNWTPKVTDFASTVTGAKSFSVTVTVETFYGGVSVGTSTKTLTLNFPAAAGLQPTQEYWAALTRVQPAAASGIAEWVKGFSKIRLDLIQDPFTWSVEEDGQTVAIAGELDSWTVQVGTAEAVTATGTSHTSAVIQEAGHVAIRVTAADKRGFTASLLYYADVYDYTKPRGGFTYLRYKNTGTAQEPEYTASADGTYAGITPDITISGVNGANSIQSITLAAVPRDGSGGFTFTGLTNRQENIEGGSLGDKTYDLTLTVTDALGGTLTLKGKLTGTKWALKFMADASGAAFGKPAERANGLEIPETWNFLKEGEVAPAYQTVKTASTDLDDYTVNGFYNFGAAYEPVNRPAYGSANGWLLVLNTGVSVKQFWMCYGTLDTNDHYTYVRSGDTNSGTWSSWKQLWTSGDTIPVTYGGTGATSAADARTNLGASNGVWPVSLGGTGATSTADARTNLGVKALSTAFVSVDNIALTARGTSGDYASGTISAARSGYTPICVVGWGITNASTSGAYSSYCALYGLWLNSSGNVEYRVKNHCTSAAKIKITAVVLYGN